jgi:hypothetical protein
MILTTRRQRKDAGPPISTPRYPVTRCSVDISAMFAKTLPILVRTAANPTTECNAATVCGNSVAVIRRPINRPRGPQY